MNYVLIFFFPLFYFSFRLYIATTCEAPVVVQFKLIQMTIVGVYNIILNKHEIILISFFIYIYRDIKYSLLEYC